MNVVGQVAAGVAALVHVLFFALESVWFSRPAVYKRFLVAPQEVEAVRPMAFNQGFYNLFLAVGVVGGLIAASTGSPTVGRTLILFACGCMALAGVVLISTDRRFARAALVQILPPAVVFAAALV